MLDTNTLTEVVVGTLVNSGLEADAFAPSAVKLVSAWSWDC